MGMVVYGALNYIAAGSEGEHSGIENITSVTKVEMTRFVGDPQNCPE